MEVPLLFYLLFVDFYHLQHLRQVLNTLRVGLSQFCIKLPLILCFNLLNLIVDFLYVWLAILRFVPNLKVVTQSFMEFIQIGQTVHFQCNWVLPDHADGSQNILKSSGIFLPVFQTLQILHHWRYRGTCRVDRWVDVLIV